MSEKSIVFVSPTKNKKDSNLPIVSSSLNITEKIHEDGIVDIISQGRSETTRSVYEDNFRYYQLWALEEGFPYLPATQKCIEFYILFLRDKEHKIATIELRLTAIKAIHKAFGVPFPKIPHFPT